MPNPVRVLAIVVCVAGSGSVTNNRLVGNVPPQLLVNGSNFTAAANVITP
jgi:hypothetical protein